MTVTTSFDSFVKCTRTQAQGTDNIHSIAQPLRIWPIAWLDSANARADLSAPLKRLLTSHFFLAPVRRIRARQVSQGEQPLLSAANSLPLGL